MASLLEIALFPGTGHYALGLRRQGLVWFTSNLALWAGLIVAGLTASRTAFWVIIVMAVVLRIASAVDCYRRRERPRFRWRNVLVMSVLVAVGIFAALEVVDAHLLAVFRTPTASMYPALSPGDHIVVSKLERQLNRGDIVVFRSPEDPEQLLVKRIIALPGELVQMDGRAVVVDGRRFSLIPSDAACDLAPGCELWEESSQAHRCHLAFSPSAVPARHADQPLQVPDASLFVLGDNRDNSLDSRVFGPVAVSDVVGKVQFTWLSASAD
jgi:signal peptidase I